jgi:hypothetical protein
MSRRFPLRAGHSLLPLIAVIPQGSMAESPMSPVPNPSREPTWEDLLGRR